MVDAPNVASQSEWPFYSECHPVSERWAIFEDDGIVAWLYLTSRRQERPIADCWVYNRIPAPDCQDIRQYRGNPPPACRDYAGADAQYQGPRIPIVRFYWALDGESVAVAINGAVLAAIVTTSELREGACRHLIRQGPWGKPWDEMTLRATFGEGILEGS